MTTTTIPFGDPKAAKRWSADLAVDVRKKSYFEARFIGTSENSVIQRKTELESDAGDTISFDLSVHLRGEPTYGDARVEGKEENLRFFTDKVMIDQVRKSVSAGGRMSRKRTVHNIRRIARDRLGDYFYKFTDELLFIYLSGARGINLDFVETTSFQGFAGNPLEAPDPDHLLYGGAATSKASLAATDVMDPLVIERAVEKAAMMQAENPEVANMVPVSIEGDDHYVCVMSEYQATDMRTAAGGRWIDFQKAAAAAEGRNNPIFKGGLGMINNVVLHKHRNVIRFNDYGAGANVEAARALFMGRQAGVIAYGTANGMRFDWDETVKDYGNEPAIAAGFIAGMKKARFNGKDFGVISIDTAAKKHS
ncbi:N4-gp56 family major capsid protein [Burkholderia multivorans]|uniref:N4-gp56 family major capsid protein n=1 Tax=Burkholderia multivorans TaxID=87883 RepID=UPI001C2252DF|nr:N4-gp56 family major capsid protein [Burkholderia multivorans]ULR75120.1 major capsid protein [Burkholderia phage JC1]MBU9386634.1 N4-gp56 family major capsid protein [Burkholderia multivorans]MBU9437068.1 N4-gp56 family major capsid protein [Burkholderia multivorans]MBU9606273.1 N4-gp56 family major capsid protein [Burkholderia multivorans]MBU9624832.1 N4-gp56 family major capsid protein [Burkholderia multivorans]